jgi:hypothetical protein
MLNIEEIGILLTLLLTILGWGVTSFYQRQLLERQISVDKDKEIIARKLTELDKLKSWLEDGFRLWKKREGIASLPAKQRAEHRVKIDYEILDWAAKYGPFASLASTFDAAEATRNRHLTQRPLRNVISGIYRKMPVVDSAYDKFPDSSQKLDQLFADDYPEAMKRIEALIEQTARLSIGRR